MRTLHKGLVLGAMLALGASAPASAQDWKWDLGVNGGYVWTTHVLTEDNTGYSGPGHNVLFDNGARVGLSLGYNFSPRLGLRLNGHYRWTNVTGNDMPNDLNYIDGVNMWTGLADLIIRLKAPNETYAGMEMLPYLALGAGAKWHNPAGDRWLCNDPSNSQSFNCAPFATGTAAVGATGPIHGWALGEENAVAFHGGLGADWRLSRSLAFTTEVGVEAYKPQFYDANHTNGTFGTTVTLPTGENRALYDTEVTADVGLKFLFGVKSAPVVAVVPPPAPPAPTPAPTPEVRRESASVCVVDPSAPNGLRMQNVTVVEGRDTVVSQGGSDVRFSTTLPSGVMVASGADWYVQGQPLVMTIGSNKASFTTYGSARMISSSDLTYVGRINGYPVYADRDDVSSFINELNQQNASGQDLGVILNNQKTLNTTFSNVKVLYVPTTAYGCTFQAVQRQEEVRKSGK